ncbi:hypothetical protein A2U01_0065619, partial [Trifolium medium]|nr:hypothetical protein [Trifolium medium]
MTLSTEITQQFSTGLRVFVVGHDTDILNFIRNKCAQRNYEVATCFTASLARNLLKEAND